MLVFRQVKSLTNLIIFVDRVAWLSLIFQIAGAAQRISSVTQNISSERTIPNKQAKKQLTNKL